MSIDINILKETLDIVFGRMDNSEMVPIENQWRYNIEKDTLFILIKGLIRDIKEGFKDTSKETLNSTIGSNVDMVIFEKQLSFKIESGILYFLIKGSINDIQQRFELELRNILRDQIPHECLKDSLKEFLSEITLLL